MHQNYSNTTHDNGQDALGRPVKRRRRTREERGLPSDEAIAELATTYLETQHRLWPALVKSGVLPPLGSTSIATMAASFKLRFLSADPFANLPTHFGWHQVAASYSRYSDPGSNPRSLGQQLKLQLEKAQPIGDFIPWELVFADAAVTATTAKRRGYELTKAALADKRFSISTLYIDELGRASRDAIESLILGKLLEDLEKRLIGVSDGFDSNSQMSKMLLQMFAMVQEWFVDQLRAKVKRGMDDAFERGGNVGLPAPGFKLVPMLDQFGSPVRGADGDQLNTLAIDESTSEKIFEVFVMYVEKRISPEQIAQFLNGIEFMGSQSWDGSRVRKILRRYAYVGVITYRMTRQVRNRTTGTVKVIHRPRKEWKVRRARHLQIVPYPLWKKAKRLLAAGHAAWSKNRDPQASRTEVYPATLVRPTCGCCDTLMSLGRSGKYAAFVCLNGLHGKHGCTYRGYKAVGIVERAILGVIRERILTPEVVDDLVVRANGHLARLSKMPKTSTKTEKAALKKLCKQRDNLYELAAEGQQLKTLGDRIHKLEEQIDELRAEIHHKEIQNAPAPGPVTRSQVEAAFNHLRDLLAQDTAAAAPILRKLTGPIVIEQATEKGKKRATWTAKFTVNLVPVLAELRASKDCPTTGIWEYLCTRGWTMPQEISLPIGRGTRYEALAAEVLALANEGVPLTVIAAKKSVTWDTVRNALRLAKSGERPPSKPSRQNQGGKPKATVYKDIAAEVVRLREVEKLTIPQTAIILKVSESTVCRAYRLQTVEYP